MSDPPDPNEAAWGYVSPGESRWPACIAIVVAIILQLRIPEQLSIGPFWLIPAIEGLILATLIVVGPSTIDREARDVRWISITLIVTLGVTDMVRLGLLLHHLLNDDTSIQGRTLIFSAVGVWITAVVAFGLGYWEMDRGGPIRRCSIDHPAPDFMFPQMDTPGVSKGPWTPRFFDYLYMSLTNSTAFSPTDVMPLTTRAKLLMGVQSLVSLATIVVVGARAVNILK